jgi:multidrug efflux pump subunit AcrA (membrane-fusion protein)
VLNDGDQSLVMVVGTDNAYRSVKVEVGPENAGKVRVISGLNAGDRIVTQGALFLQKEQANQ